MDSASLHYALWLKGLTLGFFRVFRDLRLRHSPCSESFQVTGGVSLCTPLISHRPTDASPSSTSCFPSPMPPHVSPMHNLLRLPLCFAATFPHVDQAEALVEMEPMHLPCHPCTSHAQELENEVRRQQSRAESAARVLQSSEKQGEQAAATGGGPGSLIYLCLIDLMSHPGMHVAFHGHPKSRSLSTGKGRGLRPPFSLLPC